MYSFTLKRPTGFLSPDSWENTFPPYWSGGEKIRISAFRKKPIRKNVKMDNY